MCFWILQKDEVEKKMQKNLSIYTIYYIYLLFLTSIAKLLLTMNMYQNHDPQLLQIH